MIPKITALAIFLGISLQRTVYGAAYSKVYVQSGPDVIPVEYLNYGAPPIVTSPQIAQLSAPPVGSVLPLPNIVTPCVSPCILPGQTVATVAAVQPTAKYIKYNKPSAVVVPANDDKTSYEYSYVVYDEITGDRKAQRELSDGSVVQGEYSLIQPDGYVREVKYTADDLTGFNAIVTKFLPESALGRDKKPDVKTDAALPCEDTKKEAIKVEPEADTLKTTQEPIREEGPKTVNEELNKSDQECPHDHYHDHVPGDGYIHDHFYDNEHFHEHAHESNSNPEGIDLTVVPTVEVAPIVVSSTAQSEPEYTPTEKLEPTAELIKQPAAVPFSNNVQNDNASTSHESLQKPAAQESTKPMSSIPNGLVLYSDIIRCVQAAIANNPNVAKSNISPLTYIILPGLNKAC